MVRICIDYPRAKYANVKEYNSRHTRQLNVTKVLCDALDVEIDSLVNVMETESKVI